MLAVIKRYLHHMSRYLLGVVLFLLWPANRSTGKPITHEDLFRYTNGHFLIDEKLQFGRRYVKFDLDRLCDIAASVGDSRSPISAVEKLEGGFSKALLMRRENGTELIAKLPCPNAGPALYTTASEVAVMQYGNGR